MTAVLIFNAQRWRFGGIRDEDGESCPRGGLHFILGVRRGPRRGVANFVLRTPQHH